MVRKIIVNFVEMHWLTNQFFFLTQKKIVLIIKKNTTKKFKYHYNT